MQKNKNRRRRLYEIVSEVTEMPADAVSSVPTFVIRGLHEVEADGCDGILEFSENRVTLEVGERRVTVTGNSITLSDFSDGVLFVRGNIDSVRLTEGTECSDV